MKVTFDANIFVSRPFTKLPQSFYMSAVVLQELIAGAEDAAAVKVLESAYREYHREGRLLVPLAEDWLLAGKVLNSLQRGRRDHKTKLIPRISVEERLRITNDVLIARTAKRENVIVVTDNINDFEKIRSFCAVQIKSGSDYFGE